MELIKTAIIVVQMLTAVSIVFLVLLQHGKGADMGAAFGSGSAGSLFGASGSANFLSRTTAVLATIFFLSTLGLSLLGSYKPHTSAGVLGQVPAHTSSQPASTTSAPTGTAGQGPVVPK
ncbi:MAG: preprotein translocase subunit SecG [Ottowia sp.]|nr:preprotein translocase subunit SecG [Ottowia sp.]